MVLWHHFLRLSSALPRGGFFFLIGAITGTEIIFLLTLLLLKSDFLNENSMSTLLTSALNNNF